MQRTRLVKPMFLAVGFFFACAGAMCARNYEQNFANWQAEYFTTLQLVDQAICGQNVDPDQDGLNNLQEYVFALDPLHKDSRRGITGITLGSNSMNLAYTRLSHPAGLTFIPEVSTHLTFWTSGVVLATNTALPTGTGVLQRVDEEVVLQQDAPAQFARLSVAWTGRTWKADVLWQNQSTYGMYLCFITGTNLMNAGTLWESMSSAWIPEHRADLDHNGQGDIIWRNTSTYDVWYWLLDGTNFTYTNCPVTVGMQWTLPDTGDLNGDGKDDILWRNSSSGDLCLWTMNGGELVTNNLITSGLTAAWNLKTGAFSADDKDDILLHNPTAGDVYIWLMDGPTITSTNQVMTGVSSQWAILFTGDFDGDGSDDILWQNTSSGEVYVWFMDGPVFRLGAHVAYLSTGWKIEMAADFNGDHKTDLLVRSLTTGDVYVWIMDGATIAATALLMPSVSPSAWKVIP